MGQFVTCFTLGRMEMITCWSRYFPESVCTGVYGVRYSLLYYLLLLSSAMEMGVVLIIFMDTIFLSRMWNLLSVAKYTCCPKVLQTRYLFSVSHPVTTAKYKSNLYNITLKCRVFLAQLPFPNSIASPLGLPITSPPQTPPFHESACTCTCSQVIWLCIAP